MNDTSLMQHFPSPEGAQVTLANWRKPPFIRWSFQHVSEIVPSADIANDPDDVRLLPAMPIDLSDVTVELEGRNASLSAVLDGIGADSLVVVKDGVLVYENYLGEMHASSRHILMSVSKSVLGLLAGILA